MDLKDYLLHKTDTTDSPPRQLKTTESERLAKEMEEWIASGHEVRQCSVEETGMTDVYVLMDGSFYDKTVMNNRLIRAGQLGRQGRGETKSEKAERLQREAKHDRQHSDNEAKSKNKPKNAAGSRRSDARGAGQSIFHPHLSDD